MAWAITLVLLGALLIGAGGILGTLGWRELENAKRRQALLKTLAAEFMVNAAVVNDRKFHETDEAALRLFVVFPRFQTVGLAAANASGQFVGSDDRKLFTAIVSLHEQLIDANRRFDMAEDAMLNGTPDDRARWRATLRDGRILKAIRADLASFSTLLREAGIPLDARFYEPK